MNSLQTFSLRKKLYFKLSVPDLSITTAQAWKGCRLCPSKGYNYVCPSELYSRNHQHVKTRCCCQWCLKKTNSIQQLWVRGFQMSTSTSDTCLQLGIFTELRSFSKPQVKIQLLIKQLKISFLNIQACWKSFMCCLLTILIDLFGQPQNKYFLSSFTFEMRFLPLEVCLRYLISMDKNRQLLQRQTSQSRGNAEK